jgi:hypothetical protein
MERFLGRVRYAGNDRCGLGRCWEWAGRTQSGYAYFPHRGEGSRMAHRFSYEALVGPVPKGRKLVNACGDRECVNPEHWSLAS